MKKYVVTLHRSYEIPEDLVERRSEELNNKYSAEEIAGRIAMDLMAEESGEFEDFSDFVSFTVEEVEL